VADIRIDDWDAPGPLGPIHQLNKASIGDDKYAPANITDESI